jgi:hypothetical protein
VFILNAETGFTKVKKIDKHLTSATGCLKTCSKETYLIGKEKRLFNNLLFQMI